MLLPQLVIARGLEPRIELCIGAVLISSEEMGKFRALNEDPGKRSLSAPALETKMDLAWMIAGGTGPAGAGVDD